jgi:hypothetical protein
LHHKYQKMEKVNQNASNSFQQRLDRCIEGCITLHEDIAMTDPYLEIAARAVQIAKQELSATVDPKTKEVGTVHGVEAKIPAASKLHGPTSTQTKSVTVFAETAKIDTMDTQGYLLDTPNGRFNQVTAWIKAIGAVENAIKGAQEAWDHILPALQSVIEAVVKWIGRDEATVAKLADKLSMLSFYASVYRVRSTLYATFVDTRNHNNKSLVEKYIKNHIAVTGETVDSLKKTIDDSCKLHLDDLIKDWKKDMCGMWVTTEMMIQSRSTTMESAWIEVKDQVAKMMKVIMDAKWNMIAKRPYTEVRFASIYNNGTGTDKVCPPVLEAKAAFEGLEEAIEQIEKDISTFAKALDELFPSNNEAPSGS